MKWQSLHHTGVGTAAGSPEAARRDGRHILIARSLRHVQGILNLSPTSHSHPTELQKLDMEGINISLGQGQGFLHLSHRS